MRLAANMVREGRVSIKEIARDSGYADISNFYRDFKQVHGLTPRQLRVGQLTALTESAEWRGDHPIALTFCKYCKSYTPNEASSAP